MDPNEAQLQGTATHPPSARLCAALSWDCLPIVLVDDNLL